MAQRCRRLHVGRGACRYQGEMHVGLFKVLPDVVLGEEIAEQTVALVVVRLLEMAGTLNAVILRVHRFVMHM